MVWHAGSPTRTVYADVTLTQSKVKVTEHLNYRQLAMPCMLSAMTAAPLQGFLVCILLQILISMACALISHTLNKCVVNCFIGFYCGMLLLHFV